MLNPFSPAIVETADGIYQPPALRQELALTGLFIGALGGLVFFGKMAPFLGAFYAVLLAIRQVSLVRTYRRFGSLGRPLLSVTGGRLTILLPLDSRACFTVDLAELHQAVVYGPGGRSRIRFIKIDGSHVEVSPMWRAAVSIAAIAFLRKALPHQVIVDEPQTEFQFIRGDGPSTDA